MKKILATILVLFTVLSLFAGCTKQKGQVVNSNAPVVGDLVYDYSLQLKYAESFSVDYFKNGYVLLTVTNKAKYLVVPEGKDVPKGIDGSIIILKKPFTGVYVANAPTVSLINAMNALDKIKYTGTDIADNNIQSIATAMNEGKLIFGGKYNTPDYEKLSAAHCNLVIESTMIDTTPDVAAKFSELGIPVLVDYSNLESDPLGRVEWIKFYAALFGIDMNQANKVFDKQVAVVEKLDKKSTGKTVAIFYITTKGTIYVRNTNDYLTKMVQLAGGEYIPSDLKNAGSNSTAMDMESFYAKAKDADYLIYIYSIGGKPNTLPELLKKNALLADFKAVKDGNVWATCNEFFQIGDSLGSMIGDIHTILTSNDKNLSKLTYLFKLQ